MNMETPAHIVYRFDANKLKQDFERLIHSNCGVDVELEFTEDNDGKDTAGQLLVNLSSNCHKDLIKVVTLWKDLHNCKIFDVEERGEWNAKTLLGTLIGVDYFLLSRVNCVYGNNNSMIIQLLMTYDDNTKMLAKTLDRIFRDVL